MLQPFQKTFSNQTDLLESSLNNPNSLKPPKFSSFQDKPTSTFEARIINSSYLLPTRKKSKLFSKGTCQTPALKYIETERSFV
jgi:hypothetical protein